MAAKAKASSPSCLSFLKDSLLLLTRNHKLFVPVFLLIAIPTFLPQITNVLCIQPLTTDILLHINEVKSMDPSNADYAKLMAEIVKETRELLIVSISVMVYALAHSLATQIVSFFAASTTYSGDRYSLPELFSKVITKGRHLRGPLITVAMVSALNVAYAVLLAALLQLVVRRFGALYMAAVLALPFLASLYLSVVFGVAVFVSVADSERRGAGALRRAWRLMTRAWRKGGCVLVVVVQFLGMVPAPVHAVAVGYWKKSVPVGIALLAVHVLLSGLAQLFYYSAATVYYYQAMESKEVMAHDYVKIPTGEAAA